MATLTYSRFGNPGRRHHPAHYTIVHKKSMTRAFLPAIMHNSPSIARKYQSSGRGARRLAAAH